VLAAGVAGCDSPSGPGGGPAAGVRFLERALDLDTLLAGTATLRNAGPEPALNIRVTADSLKAADGTPLSASVDPSLLDRLDPGAEVVVTVSVEPAVAAAAGPAAGWLSARGAAADSIRLTLRLTAPGIAIAPRDSAVRQGDVFELRAVVTRNGRTVAADPAWSVVAGAGFVDTAGAAVGYADSLVVAATVPGAADTARFAVLPRGVAGRFRLVPVGNGAVVERYTSDLWAVVRGGRTYAYTGTWGQRALRGHVLYAWDATDPAAPARVDSVVVGTGAPGDVSTLNDVKVSADGSLGVVTLEGAAGSGSGNGIVLLDLADPAHPVVRARYGQGLGNGVHNVWIEAIGGRTYVFACHDGDPASGLHVIDVTDIARPVTVAEFGVGTAPSEFVHDVLVRDGLAFVSHWDAGLVVVDVGNGIAGGRPDAPRLVSRLVLPEGNVHNAWYWPERALVFVGHEFGGQIGVSSAGLVSVVDVTDLRAPRRVATFARSDAGPHNFWVDEADAVLYAAYYNAGLLAIDVSGRLLGALDRQGRLVAEVRPGGDGNTYVWAPQLVAPGTALLSDMLTGLWAVSLAPGP
jgi:hypothetical protein